MGLEIDTPRVAAGTLELAEFCRSEHPRLVGMLTLYCGDRDLAQELAQETIVRAIQHWKKVRSLQAPSAWARRVAVNLANSWMRRTIAKRKATQRLSARTGHLHNDRDTAGAVAVRKAVADLPSRQKTAIVLRYYADLPVDEVARIMGCKQGTVWALSNQAIASLRKSGLTEIGEVTSVD
jgi:RNA polymerase sigma factor (sigma-70 family)